MRAAPALSHSERIFVFIAPRQCHRQNRWYCEFHFRFFFRGFFFWYPKSFHAVLLDSILIQKKNPKNWQRKSTRRFRKLDSRRCQLHLWNLDILCTGFFFRSGLQNEKIHQFCVKKKITSWIEKKINKTKKIIVKAVRKCWKNSPEKVQTVNGKNRIKWNLKKEHNLKKLSYLIAAWWWFYELSDKFCDKQHPKLIAIIAIQIKSFEISIDSSDKMQNSSSVWLILFCSSNNIDPEPPIDEISFFLHFCCRLHRI